MTLKVYVIHGPNINLLGQREPEFYGQDTFDELNIRIKEHARGLDIETRIMQSNSEGQIVDAIHEALPWADAIIINPGAYTHYSYAIRDAIAAVRLPAIEVHLTNVHGREEWRRHSVISPVCTGQIIGFASNSYLLALNAARTVVDDSRR
ncbi:MAG TPA: type II 3-dehydroquinate dehydratase [Chthonomonadales bacterium]|nr:type II 3-dehydroquinate dehydratase [Chthonomonadales bacterium]